MTPHTVDGYERSSFRAELTGLAVLGATILVVYLSIGSRGDSYALMKTAFTRAKEQGRGVYPMLARYDPGGRDKDRSRSLYDLQQEWMRRVEGDLLRARLERDWAETPPLPTGPDPMGSSPDPGLLVDRKRNEEFLRSLSCLIDDARRRGDADRTARGMMAMLAAVRDAVHHEARAAGGFLPCNQALFWDDLLRPTLDATILCGGTVSRALLRDLLSRAIAVDELMPFWRRSPDAWPALAATLLSDHDVQLDTTVLARQLQFPLPPVMTVRHLYDRETDPDGRGQFLDYLPFRFAMARRVARDFEYQALWAPAEWAGPHLALGALAVVTASLLRRDETGAWPRTWEDLAGLVPQRMRQDPTTGDVLRFIATEAGPLVWSPDSEGDLRRDRPTEKCKVLAGRLPEGEAGP